MMGGVSEKVAVIGLGRVGLPLALYLAKRGCTVQGIETNETILGALESGRMPFLEEGAEELLSEQYGKRFFAGNDLAVLGEVDTIIVSLGTPVDQFNSPIVQPIENLVLSMLPHLKEGQLLILRSTVAPGTTENLGRLIERKTSFRLGRDLLLSFCPERIAEGKALRELPEVPQIVGGIDEASTKRAATFFGPLTKSVLETDARSAELAKLFCNMYRYINFAIANEFMMIAAQHDRDFYPILDAVNTGYKRGGLKGPGLTGGPCLYKDGFFLIEKIPFNELITGAWKINETVPAYLVEQVRAHKTIDGSKVAVLGLAFKKDIDDTRNSLAYKLKKLLLAGGADVHCHDPLVPSESLAEALLDADIVFLAMNHDEYRELGIAELRGYVRANTVICDIWNVLETNRIVFPISEIEAGRTLDPFPVSATGG